MPVIRVSNEAYQKILKLQAEDGNSMSIFMDRLMTKVVKGGASGDGLDGDKGGAKKVAKRESYTGRATPKKRIIKVVPKPGT